MKSRSTTAYRLVSVGLVLPFVVKGPKFLGIYRDHATTSIEGGLFPWPFAHIAFVAAVFAVGLGVNLLSVAVANASWFRYQSAVNAVVFPALIVSAPTFARQGFVVGFWVNLWLGWGARVRPSEGAEANWGRRAEFLAALLVSFVFLGAVVGKLTDGYWSGEVVYRVYLAGHPTVKFHTLRSMFDPAELAALARVAGKVTVVAELTMVALFFAPRHLRFTGYAVGLFGMFVVLPIGTLEATGPLWGLVLAVVYLRYDRRE